MSSVTGVGSVVRTSGLLAVVTMLGLLTGCERVTGIASVTPQMVPMVNALDLDPEPGDVELHHGATHRIIIRHDHLVVDTKDFGALRPQDEASLINRFHGQDSTIASVSRMTTAALAKIRNRIHRVKSHGPFVEEGEWWASPTTSFATVNGPSRNPLGSVSTGMHNLTIADWCSISYQNQAQCAWFAIDFGYLQDEYVKARQAQGDALATWLNGEGADMIEAFFAALGDLAPGEALATATMEAISFFTDVKDYYETYAIMEMGIEINTDTWIYNTMGISDWGGIDCKDSFWTDNGDLYNFCNADE